MVKLVGSNEVASRPVSPPRRSRSSPGSNARYVPGGSFPGQKSAKQALDDVDAGWQRAIGRVGGLK
jgi:hypothetical protein